MSLRIEAKNYCLDPGAQNVAYLVRQSTLGLHPATVSIVAESNHSNKPTVPIPLEGEGGALASVGSNRWICASKIGKQEWLLYKFAPEYSSLEILSTLHARKVAFAPVGDERRCVVSALNVDQSMSVFLVDIEIRAVKLLRNFEASEQAVLGGMAAAASDGILSVVVNKEFKGPKRTKFPTILTMRVSPAFEDAIIVKASKITDAYNVRILTRRGTVIFLDRFTSRWTRGRIRVDGDSRIDACIDNKLSLPEKSGPVDEFIHPVTISDSERYLAVLVRVGSIQTTEVIDLHESDFLESPRSRKREMYTVAGDVRLSELGRYGHVHQVHIAQVVSEFGSPPSVEVFKLDTRVLDNYAESNMMESANFHSVTNESVSKFKSRRIWLETKGYERELFVLEGLGLRENQTSVILVCIHGGPGGTWTSKYHPTIDYLLEKGSIRVALMPNLMGSLFAQQGLGDQVSADYFRSWKEECLDVLKYARQVYGGKIVIYGESFGGLLALNLTDSVDGVISSSPVSGRLENLSNGLRAKLSRLYFDKTPALSVLVESLEERGTTPILNIFDRKDPVVPHEDSRLVDRLCNELTVNYNVVWINEGVHVPTTNSSQLSLIENVKRWIERL